jgi:hypothetical protein
MHLLIIKTSTSHSATQPINSITIDNMKKISDKPKIKDGNKIPMQNSIIKFHDKQLISPSGWDKNINAKPTTNISLHRFGLIDKTRLTANERKQPWLEDMINDNNHPLHAVFADKTSDSYQSDLPIRPIPFTRAFFDRTYDYLTDDTPGEEHHKDYVKLQIVD